MTRPINDTAMLGVISVFVALVLWYRLTGWGLPIGDYAQYVSHAKALTEGRPYTQIGYIFTGYAPWVAPPAYPPGLPLTLVPVLLLAGPNMLVIRFVMLVLACAFVWAVAKYFNTDRKPLGTLVALFLVAVPSVARSATFTLTDLPFCALVWSVMILVDHTVRRDWKWMVGVILLGGAVMAYRTIGVTLVPAMLLYAVLHRRTQGWRPAIPAMVLGVTGVIVLVALNFNALSWAVPAASAFDPRSVFSEVVAMRSLFMIGHLYPFPGDLLNDGYHVITMVLMLIGWFVYFREHPRRLLHIFLAVYLVAILLINVRPPERFLWPFFPLMAFGILNGFRGVLERLSAFTGRYLAVMPIVVGTAVAVAGGSILWGLRQEKIPLTEERPEVQEVFARLRVIAATSQPRVVFYRPRVLTWETGIAAMRQFPALPDDTIVELCRQGISHVVLADTSRDAGQDRWIWRTVVDSSEWFQQDLDGGGFNVYRFIQERCSAAGADLG